MSSNWVNHVKKYARENGVSYGEAMTLARSSYTPVKKGKGIGNIVRKTRNTLKKARKVSGNTIKHIDKYGELARLVDEDAYNNLNKVSKSLNKVNDVYDDINGGSFKSFTKSLKKQNVGRKLRNSVNTFAPLASVLAPEFAPEIMAVQQGINAATTKGGRVAMTRGGKLGSKNNKYLALGGSFMVPKRGGAISSNGGVFSHCMSQMAGAGYDIHSSLISTSHPSYKPAKINL